MLKKLCSYPGCHKVVEAGVKYCDRHKNTDREKYREYKRKRMENEEEARRQQFYNSKAWEGFRANQEAAQLGVDIFEYYTMNESAFYEDLLIFKGFTMDGINTEAVRTIVKSTIDVQIKAQNYLNTLFDNGLTNKMVIQLTSDIRDEKELKKIQEKFGKLYSKGKRIFTVPAGFNVQPVNLSLADAQYEQIRRMSISQIAALFGIKMYQLNDLKDTNNNSLEQQQLSFLVDTLLILYESIEQEVTWGCLTKDDRAQGYKAKHNTNVILRSSPETQQKILCAYVAGGIIKPNEARLELGRETTEDGDDLIVNAGVLKLKDLGKDTKGNAGE